MSSVNRVIILGRLGATPELRQPDDTSAVCRLSVATNRSWTDSQGQKKEEVCWHRVSVWGKQGEACHRYLSKGRQVCVEGRLRSYQFTDPEGNKRYGTEIVSDKVTFLPRGQREQEAGEAPSAAEGDQEDKLPF